MTLHSGRMSGVHWRCCSTPRSGSSLTWCRPGFYSAAAGAHATDQQQQQRNVSFTLLSIMSRGSAAPLFHISSAFLASMGGLYIVVHQQSSAVLVAFPNFHPDRYLRINTAWPWNPIRPNCSWLDIVAPGRNNPVAQCEEDNHWYKTTCQFKLDLWLTSQCQCSVHLGADKNVFKPLHSEFCSKQSHCWLTFANFFHSFNTSNSCDAVQSVLFQQFLQCHHKLYQNWFPI